jgi:hypothetical protein
MQIAPSIHAASVFHPRELIGVAPWMIHLRGVILLSTTGGAFPERLSDR